MKVIKKDYTSGKEVVTDVSDEIVEIYFCPRKNEVIHFEIKIQDVPAMINILQRSFDGHKIKSFKPVRVEDVS